MSAAPAQKAIIKSADMPEELQAAAIELARDALQKFETERDMAKHIKVSAPAVSLVGRCVLVGLTRAAPQVAFDEQHGKHWHCVVGKAFGSFVTHDSGCFTYFYLGEVAVLLFKTL